MFCSGGFVPIIPAHVRPPTLVNEIEKIPRIKPVFLDALHHCFKVAGAEFYEFAQRFGLALDAAQSRVFMIEE